MFFDLIFRVSRKLPISKAEVILVAQSKGFIPTFEQLSSQHGNLAVQKLYNKVRTFGNSRKGQLFIENQIRSNPDNSRYTSNTFMANIQISHHRSIFTYTEEERLFNQVFRDLINRVANKQTVRRREILERAFNSERFAPLLLKMKSQPKMEIKILNKVRYLGHKNIIDHL